MQLNLAELRKRGVEVLAISGDSPEESRKMAESAGIEFPLLSDPDLTVVDLYGLRHDGASIDGSSAARPATFLIDEQGAVRWKELTENWRIRLRPERVFEALDDLG